MKIDLKKPIVFFDLETTGINPATDRIVEISILKVWPNGKQDSKTYRINPEMPIPPRATEVHGISDEDVKNAPTFKMIAAEIVNILSDADIAGYNCNKFDIPLLAEEFIRSDVEFDFKKRNIVDVMVIFMKKEPRNLEAAYKFYCNKELENAHSANADTLATFEVFAKQLEKYQDLGSDISQISEFSSHSDYVDFAGRLIYDEDKNVIVNFGKYKGLKLYDVFAKDSSYYDWVQKGEFPLYTKKKFTEEYLKFKASKK
ncbi:MAG TPA: 3'-5' exonuclease [Bacteroidales bacterium]|nr:3'-5' exonuclease [Bacteroidales bacterium]HOL98405.1 3'-5' exonuclease [Bacteroidales bacterium]HOM36697.1 3'-5' exonuclease [Bacteroidales bacterium]HPD24166.1 3'-5' exonuclease [Bacteroidales bacterium]HRT00153.1 3'-5' exonuclease [Bacteroidales bacterium]